MHPDLNYTMRLNHDLNNIFAVRINHIINEIP